MLQLEQALENFHADLARSIELLNLLKTYRSFAAEKVSPALAETWPSAKSLKEMAVVVRTDLPILSGSLHLYLCGRFERCIRDLIEAFVDDLTSRVGRYDELPAALRKEVLVRTLAINQSPSKFGYDITDAESLVVELARNIASDPSGGVSIRSQIVTITEANMGSSMLADIFKRVGILTLWENLGKQSGLKFYLNEPADKSCTTEAQRQLDQFMKVRNQIAHPSESTDFPDLDSTIRAAEYFKVLSAVIKDFMLVPRPLAPPAPAATPGS